MRITEKLMVKDQLISFEVFPPKTDSAFESIEWSVRELAAYNPDFMSVTYGAGGGTSQYTTKIASLIKNRLDTTALAHLTCASTPKDKIKEIMANPEGKKLMDSFIEKMMSSLSKDGGMEIPEYFVYFGIFILHSWSKRSGRITWLR